MNGQGASLRAETDGWGDQMQLGLFGNARMKRIYIPQDKKSLFYFLKSNMQKAIRRGHVEIAVESALALNGFQSGYLRRRLPIIAFEDISFANLDLVLKVEARTRVHGGFSPAWIEDVVTEMAESVKCRDLDDGYILHFWDDLDDVQHFGRGPLIPEIMGHPDYQRHRSLRIVDMAVSPASHAAHWALMERLAAERGPWTQDLVQRFKAAEPLVGTHYATGAAACLFTHTEEGRVLPFKEVETVFESPTFDSDGMYLQCALDRHVMHARIQMEFLSRDFSVPMDAIHGLLFFKGGAILNRRAIFSDYDTRAWMERWTDHIYGHHSHVADLFRGDGAFRAWSKIK